MQLYEFHKNDIPTEEDEKLKYCEKLAKFKVSLQQYRAAMDMDRLVYVNAIDNYYNIATMHNLFSAPAVARKISLGTRQSPRGKEKSDIRTPDAKKSRKTLEM